MRFKLGSSWNETFFERVTASRKRSRLDALRAIAQHGTGDGGLVGLIQENRALSEYLWRERAAFMASHVWVGGWMESNDNFLTELQSALSASPLVSLAERLFGASTRVRIETVMKLVTTRGNTGGLFKRIDENRELLQYLQTDCPEFSLIAPAVIGTIQRNDRFYTDLPAILDIAIEDPSASPTQTRVYPRQWPA